MTSYLMVILVEFCKNVVFVVCFMLNIEWSADGPSVPYELNPDLDFWPKSPFWSKFHF